MERHGHTFVAWPEDHVVMGEELEALQQHLEHYAEPFSRACSQGVMTVDSVKIGEEIITETLTVLRQPLTGMGLESVISACLGRTMTATLFDSVVGQESLHFALERLQNKNIIEDDPECGVRLVAPELPIP